ncbi:ABC transporter substrate-binding protein, partial [Phytoactinopolyspora endophytica]|uniref:ABC transporter substrate-binding protein n=1 Tax=Phytoactinopolyspora endophytica TaxID=1642495 RepID=UPI0013EDECDA
MKTTKTTRRLSLGTVALGPVMVLAACAGDGDDTDPSLNIILNGNPNGNALADIADQFSEDTGIDIEVQVLSEQQMRDRVQLNLQSQSSEMDVYMTLPSREGPLFAASGYYEPLDDYLASAPEEYDADGFAPAAMDGMTIDDEIIAMPMNVEGPVMFYRRDVFDDLGIEVPETIDELLAAAETIEAEGDGITPVTLRGIADTVAYTFGPFMHADGLTWTSDGVPTFEDPRAHEAIEQYATLARDYGPPGVINYSFNESTQLFASGEVAIELESSNLFPNTVDPENSVVADDVGVANIPGGPDGSTPTILSWGLTVSPFSEQQDAAWEFVQWATAPEAQLTMAEDGIAPPRSSLFDDPTYQEILDTEAEQEWRDALIYIQENGNT